MALYDYKCPECHVIHTVEHSINDSPEITCKLCKKVMRKVFSIGGISFKGEGFASNDKS